ncbi:ABC transporter ATP-binding protein [Desulfoprunum benzoelyticum]|uniref:Lipopolysaccharide transport system ATP-binding protein n=1 Tax=Desulfoprunum benzoelyticum TaxID=1506996 RepID=A0A840UP42_9BACT|nr:ABC transporter ATP-binding protein [Desulfoprunum benzoelyticum]MBB5346596.1 lipopolysaccharide transport system ATP-binding protein [Desulfoprunum benzoelyticum]MBM9528875.1 ABC transporter ATP-binding protein [Desulfoprunum benzoelyticum]
MSSDIAIKVEHLSKCYQIYDKPRDRLLQMLFRGHRQYYREFWALRDVSFEVKRGETVGIIGRNGSGKSTLLQMICNTLNPTSGAVETKGRVAALLELGSGFNPEFTGRENVYMNASVLGLNREEIDARFDKIAAFADIGDFIEQPVKTYSSGMYVRLAFAVIAHVDADILVIDEALSVGDAFFTQKCMRFLRRFMEDGTVLFVSHDTGAVINLCKSAIWLEQGYAKCQGEPKEIAQLYLKKLYESDQGESSLVVDENCDWEKQNVEAHIRDMRLDYINSTNCRNDIELFKFVPDADGFGKGGGSIISVQFLDTNDSPISWIVGGETIRLAIVCQAHVDLFSPIIGFFVNDKLGQNLFGDNTYNFSINDPLVVFSKTKFKAVFEFVMPILPTGDYSVTVALAEGTQQDHIQHHWLYDALLFKSHSSSVSTGLIGVPMQKINLSRI